MQHGSGDARATPTDPLVLVVDGHRDTFEMYAHALMNSGFVALHAARSAEVQQHLRTSLPDVIVTDIRLPDSSGFELIRTIRAGTLTRDIPVIVVSGSGLERDRREALAAGCDSFLVKPCLPDTLRIEIRRVLTIRMATAERGRTAA